MKLRGNCGNYQLMPLLRLLCALDCEYCPGWRLNKPVHHLDGKQLRYPATKCLIIFEAMRRYKLCYFLPRDPDQLIIPALLPSDMKQHGFATANALEFHYQFESFLPTHLISELIVECHQDIASRDGVDMVWQHGVLLESSTHHCGALIQADYHLRRLTIWLTPGPARLRLTFWRYYGTR